MAQQRMFNKHITNDERFLEMPLSAQALYLHLGMNADDDGFVQYKQILRLTGAKESDLNTLASSGFILPIPQTENILVITHWKVNNTLKSDRYKPSFYHEHLKMLGISENKTYLPKWKHSGNILETQVRLGEVRLIKDSIDDDSKESIPLNTNTDKDIPDNSDIKQSKEDTPRKESIAAAEKTENKQLIALYMNLLKEKKITYINVKADFSAFSNGLQEYLKAGEPFEHIKKNMQKWFKYDIGGFVGYKLRNFWTDYGKIQAFKIKLTPEEMAKNELEFQEEKLKKLNQGK